MRKDHLSVIHIKKRGAPAELLALAASLKDEFCDCFCLESCQRYIWAVPAGEAGHLPGPRPGLDVLRGRDAYDFLLRVATGLESEVVGESDVFGQFKEAWRRYSEDGGPLLRELNPWMQRLFEDTKEIRSLHMRDIGGASYGSLVRRMLPKRAPGAPREKVLIAGAGQLALSIAPWLAEYDLLLWNRTPGKLDALAAEIDARKTSDGGTVTKVAGPEAELAAWRDAAHAVVCVPADEAADAARLAAWREGAAAGNAKGLVVHLGGFKTDCGRWAPALGPGFRGLDDLFQLKDAQDSARKKAIRAARHACRERSRLRGLGGLGIPHGWEDLMGFACDRELSLSWVN